MPDLPKLRVALVAGTLGMGGAERQLYYITIALLSQGCQVWVFTLSREKEYWNEALRLLGVPVIQFGWIRSRLARVLHLTLLLLPKHPTIIQSMHTYTNIYCCVAARLLGCRDIGAVRSNANAEMAELGRLFSRASLRWPRFLAVNSRVAMSTVRDRWKRTGVTIFFPNAIDTARFSPEESALPASDTVNILGVGRFHRAKRFDRFVRVVVRCADMLGPGRPISATIAGYGAGMNGIQALIAAMDAQSYISVVQPTGEPVELYRSADIFLLTSDYEGMPNVVMEAMACGRPVVATDVGDVRDIVMHGVSGYVVRPDDEDGLVDSVAALARDSELRSRMGAKARDMATERYSLDGLAGRLGEMYRTVVDRPTQTEALPRRT